MNEVSSTLKPSAIAMDATMRVDTALPSMYTLPANYTGRGKSAIIIYIYIYI